MVLAGILAGLANYAVLRSADDSVRVAVAAETIEPGQVVDVSAFGAAEVAADDSLLDTLVRAEDVASLAGAVAVTRIGVGEIVPRTALVPAGEGFDLRRMSLPVEPGHAAGGSIRAGDRVDVIAVVDGAASFAAVDVEVVAVAERGGTGALGPVAAYHVTLAVDPETALRLAAAMHTARLEVVIATGAETLPEELRDSLVTTAPHEPAVLDEPPVELPPQP